MDFNDLQSDKLPQIDIKDKNLPIITKRAWDALIASNSPPYLFYYGNHIVRLVKREKGQILIDSLDKNKLRHVLARCANFRIFKSDEFEICPPPPYIIEDMLACPNYPLPRLSRIVNAPIFSKEGKLHLTPGYSASISKFQKFRSILRRTILIGQNILFWANCCMIFHLRETLR
jgi:putative DNA primase/helicase